MRTIDNLTNNYQEIEQKESRRRYLRKSRLAVGKIKYVLIAIAILGAIYIYDSDTISSIGCMLLVSFIPLRLSSMGHKAKKYVKKAEKYMRNGETKKAYKELLVANDIYPHEGIEEDIEHLKDVLQLQ